MPEEQPSSQSQRTGPDLKGKAVASFIIGIIGISPQILTWLFDGIDFFFEIPSIIWYLLFYLGRASFLFGIVAIILGVMGIKSSKRNYSIAGIILGFIALLSPIMSVYLGYRFFGIGR